MVRIRSWLLSILTWKDEYRKLECPVYDPTLEARGRWNSRED
jgi:hypothetical protein